MIYETSIGIAGSDPGNEGEETRIGAVCIRSLDMKVVLAQLGTNHYCRLFLLFPHRIRDELESVLPKIDRAAPGPLELRNQGATTLYTIVEAAFRLPPRGLKYSGTKIPYGRSEADVAV